MSKIAATFGIALILVGVIGYVATNFVSLTALIPAFIGLPIALLGLLAQAKESLNMHAMHAAVLVGLLGLIGTAIRGVPALLNAISGKPVKTAALVSQTLTMLLCLAFVALCVKSFIDARRNRNAG